MCPLTPYNGVDRDMCNQNIQNSREMPMPRIGTMYCNNATSSIAVDELKFKSLKFSNISKIRRKPEISIDDAEQNHHPAIKKENSHINDYIYVLKLNGN